MALVSTMRALHRAERRRALRGPVTYSAVKIPVLPGVREIRTPGSYPHEFASLPTDWRTIDVSGPTVRYVIVPMLSPADTVALRRGGLL